MRTISSPERSSRESALLRGEPAERATPWVRAGGATGERRTTDRRTGDRRGSVRRAADVPVPEGRPSFRLGDVYAEELARLREHAHQEGYAAGHAEGVLAADAVTSDDVGTVLQKDPPAPRRSQARGGPLPEGRTSPPMKEE